MVKNKKGVSDLVVAVLLIVFVITISIFTFNWIKGRTSGVMEKGEVLSEKLQDCRDFQVEFEKAYCGDDAGIIKVKLTNNNDEDLKEAFAVRLISEDLVESTIASVSDIELRAYEGKEINVFKQSGDLGFKPVSKIEFVPRFLVGKEVVFCNDNKVVLDAEGCG